MPGNGAKIVSGLEARARFMHPQFVALPLCDNCGKNPATVLITKVINHESSRQHYCESCARERALGEGWLEQLTEQLGAGNPDLQAQIHEALSELPLDDIMRSLFDESPDAHSDFIETTGEAEPKTQNSDDDGEDEEDIVPPIPIRDLSARCSHCGTTWDRLKADGRAGCASCYNEFRLQLRDVMTRLQSGTDHLGKQPRAAEKRRRRLVHLRQRRDHQLELLQSRLRDAVANERYEEAAKLRDKIKIVAATIVKD